MERSGIRVICGQSSRISLALHPGYACFAPDTRHVSGIDEAVARPTMLSLSVFDNPASPGHLLLQRRTGFVIPSESFCISLDAVALHKTLAAGLQTPPRFGMDMEAELQRPHSQAGAWERA